MQPLKIIAAILFVAVITAVAGIRCGKCSADDCRYLPCAENKPFLCTHGPEKGVCATSPASFKNATQCGGCCDRTSCPATPAPPPPSFFTLQRCEDHNCTKNCFNQTFLLNQCTQLPGGFYGVASCEASIFGPLLSTTFYPEGENWCSGISLADLIDTRICYPPEAGQNHSLTYFCPKTA